MVSKAKKIAVGFAVPISHVLLGVAGGFGAVEIVNPSQEFQAGPIVIQQTIGFGSISTFSGEKLFEAPPFDVDVDLKIIDKSETPRAIQDIKEIYTAKDGAPDSREIMDTINSKFKGPFNQNVRNLALETFFVFAAGASMAMRARTHIFDLAKRGAIHIANAGIHTVNLANRRFMRTGNIPKQFSEIVLPERPPTKLKYGGFVAGFGRDIALGIAMSGLAIAATGSQIHMDKIQPRIEDIASQPVQEYLLTGTSKMVPNFASINDALAEQLGRFGGIEQAIDEGSQILSQDSTGRETFLIISDPHNLPSAPQLTEAIARAGKVDGIIILGDFLNTGAQFEIDSLSGYSIGDTDFQGFDDISKCVEYVKGECTKEGEPFGIYALLGNHDTRTLIEKLHELGIKSLSTDPPEIFENQIALNDSCFVEEDDCQDGIYHDINRQNADNLRDSIDFQNPNRPTIGFFASDAAADEFDGELKTTIFGGKHEFSYDDEGGTTKVGVGAIGAGFPRVAEYSNAVIAEFARTPNGVEMSKCLQARWDVFDASKGMEVTSCDR